MVHGPSPSGGASLHHTLSPAERQAAINALSKLSGSATKGVASVFGGVLKSATLSGGSIHSQGIKTSAGTNLVVGRGSDTFAGGVRSSVKPAIHAVGNDTVVAGSAFTKTELTASRGSHALSADTIKAAGATATGVKAATDVKSAGHTITMADKTSITLNGVAPHNVIKPH